VEPRLRAEIHGPSEITFTLTGAVKPVRASAYRLTDGQGRALPIADVLTGDTAESVLVPGTSLDALRVHYLEIPEMGLRALVRRDPIFRMLYSPKAMGAVVSGDARETAFRIFSPRASAVRLYLYRGRDDGPADAQRYSARWPGQASPPQFTTRRFCRRSRPWPHGACDAGFRTQRPRLARCCPCRCGQGCRWLPWTGWPERFARA